MSDRTGQQLGNYRLIKRTGEDNFAEFYLSVQIQTGTHATLKVAKNAPDAATALRFQVEAYKLAQLSHPNIVHALAYGEATSTLYLALDYTSQESLRQFYPRGRQLELLQVVHYIAQIAEALHYAHELDIVHREIRPENLLLGPQQCILLNNFSVAGMGSGRPRTNVSLYYTAPEQLLRQDRPASDQYALGTLAYEWLSGAPPFTSANRQEVANQQRSQSPRPLRAIVPQVPSDVERAIMRALEKDWRARFGTVREFAEALEQATTSTFRSQPLQYPLSMLGSYDPSSALPVQHLPSRAVAPPVIAASASPQLQSGRVVPADTTRSDFQPDSGPLRQLNPTYAASTEAELSELPPPAESFGPFGSDMPSVLTNPSGPYADLQKPSIQYPANPSTPPPVHNYAQGGPNQLVALPVYAQPVKQPIYFPLTRKVPIYLQVFGMLFYSTFMAISIMGTSLYLSDSYHPGLSSIYTNIDGSVNGLAIFLTGVLVLLVVPACSLLSGAFFGSWRGFLVSLASIAGGFYITHASNPDFLSVAIPAPQAYQLLALLMIPLPLSALTVGLIYDLRKYAAWWKSLFTLMLGAAIICIWVFVFVVVVGISSLFQSVVATSTYIALGCLSICAIVLMTFPMTIIEGVMHRRIAFANRKHEQKRDVKNGGDVR